jgi:hypothetical protein
MTTYHVSFSEADNPETQWRGTYDAEDIPTIPCPKWLTDLMLKPDFTSVSIVIGLTHWEVNTSYNDLPIEKEDPGGEWEKEYYLFGMHRR